MRVTTLGQRKPLMWILKQFWSYPFELESKRRQHNMRFCVLSDIHKNKYFCIWNFTWQCDDTAMSL